MGQARLVGLMIALAAVLGLGCRQQNDLHVRDWEACPPSGDQTGATLALAGTAPTFYNFVLPLLESKSRTHQYDCVTCHPTYNQYAVVSKQSELQNIIDSLTGSNGKSPMPKIGDRVSAEHIALIKQWDTSGRPEGTRGEYKEFDEAVQALQSGTTGGTASGTSGDATEATDSDRTAAESSQNFRSSNCYAN